ncbi:DUF4255 domain-containing protein [Nocardioides albidus]|uniref:DUF4255 domain-containing protein n=1 Tax=Nocardioides albidus TaxID=1517589 RepID=A0A5C4VUW2_9ACTN|nr:DUF4255 domain-containing protein [Nocardioides albidus]TNM39694.1 DUF4255 domain-containing protein [Nocardioides albidus]
MIAQVDAALREIVTADALEGQDLDVVFDAPTKDWAARRNAPTVNLYLYDIREDLKRRPSGFMEERNEDGIVVVRRPAARFFKLSYLVTAWTQRSEDEHQLLDGLLRAFLQYDALPDRLVTGPLAEPGEAVKMTIGLPPPEDRAFADVWSALGGELKPSLDLVLIAPMWTGREYAAGPPVEEGMLIDAHDVIDGGGDARRQKHVPPPAEGPEVASVAPVGAPRRRGRG